MRRARFEPRTSRSRVRGVNHSATHASTKTGLVTIPNKFSFLLHLDEAKYHWQRNNLPTIIYDNRAPGWPPMNFCRTFKVTARKEIGKIYTVRGRKFFLSLPAPYTFVVFCELLSRGFPRLPQKGELARGLHPYKLRAQPQFLRAALKDTTNQEFAKSSTRTSGLPECR